MEKRLSKPIYLDYNATTPIDPDVLKVMLPNLKEHFGNPSSGYVYGQHAKEAVEDARAYYRRLGEYFVLAVAWC